TMVKRTCHENVSRKWGPNLLLLAGFHPARRTIRAPTTTDCPKKPCPARGHLGQGHSSRQSRKAQRCICHPCQKTCSATPGTGFSRLRPAAETVGLVVTLLAPGCPVHARAVSSATCPSSGGCLRGGGAGPHAGPCGAVPL